MLEQLRAKPFHLTDKDIEWVRETMSEMTTEEKIGQLFIVAEIPFSPVKQDLMSIKPGGIHLFAMGPEATKRRQSSMIGSYQSESRIPLLISGDLESGGIGGACDGTNLAMNMQVAATGDPALAEAFGAAIAAEGAAMGYNWVFGPVADINYNFQNPIVNTRAFGDAPDTVEAYAVPALKGIQADGVMAACAKHWPGDGMDDRDQHKVLTVNSMSMEAWRGSYGRVFRAAVEAGVKTVMSAHIALPAYFDELGNKDIRTRHTPGSLSRELNEDLLRQELGFNGLIVSDATSMVGMTSFGPRKSIVPQCIAAGVDMFLFSSDIAYDYAAMLQGLQDGVLTEERLDEAVARILGLKTSLGLHRHRQALPGEEFRLEAVGSAAHLELAGELAARSVTLVKDTQRLLPISPEKHKRVLLLYSADEEAVFAERGDGGAAFERMLASRGFEVEREHHPRHEDNGIDLVLYLVQKSPSFMASSLRLTPKEAGGPFVWYPASVPTLFVSLGSPYILYEMPSMPTVVNAYNASAAVQEAVLSCLLGQRPFLGRSPVDAFCGQEWARL
ncbi:MULTISPECIES: glycoside hydrolase family 3 N-terminal domain-containing protein [unclassified Paenibacillus]|uniref:glycoside hydrolase family 3 protein n=1 Tax=unclassified Paenibacillus TaxID=185978 RepID=UPI000954361F|nr:MULTISPECIES: glycoside hydrolase family 3 N-terminal domain-containing protein [unclassified Paenibacillus]ASS68619.2 glycoside hydrolase family 3 protein [Paenibacillus sp. RUD330]SIR64801.1 beta-N-acetylhexosaminidase [Paenibacillus sp. RU4X]SIR72749.1 beta-N-acetylhexosaminidase [Paenibacillus sp. RU4T]